MLSMYVDCAEEYNAAFAYSAMSLIGVGGNGNLPVL